MTPVPSDEDRDEPLLSIRDLRVVFRDRRGHENVAVEGFDADLVKGRQLAIVGESGSGKSVSMRSLLQLLPPTAQVSGQARFDGHELLGMPEERMQPIRGRRIGMIFQNAARAFNPSLTLHRQLTEHLLWHRICDKRDALELAVDTLDRVGIPNPAKRIKLYPFQLSGGMLQRAMIALALVARPDILIADEPTTAVDVTLQRQVLDLLNGLCDDGLSMIMITHDLGVARYTCDDVVVMQEGRIVETGEIATLTETATTPYARKLLAAALDVDTEAEVDSDADQPSGDADPATDTRPPALLEATDLTKVFDGAAGAVTAVDQVDITIGTGEVVGVVGESGSGKSTLARLVLRLIEPTSGEISFERLDLFGRGGAAMNTLRRSAQMVFQNPYGSLMPHRTAIENVAEPLRLHRIGTTRERRTRARDLLEQVGIPANRGDHYPRQFSGGQQQRIAIARALALEPRLLVCDEPTSALDVSIQAEILDLLNRLRDEYGLSMLFITHNLAVAQQMCDRVVVMTRGSIVESGPTDLIFTDPHHAYTRALISAVLPVRGEPLPWEPAERFDPADQVLVEVAPTHWVRSTQSSPDHSGPGVGAGPEERKQR